MKNLNYKDIVQQACTIIAADIFAQTGIKCHYVHNFNKDQIESFECGILKNSTTDEWILHFKLNNLNLIKNYISEVSLEFDDIVNMYFKQAFFTIINKYSSYLAKDLIVFSKPSAVLPQKLGLNINNVNNMIQSVNNDLLKHTQYQEITLNQEIPLPLVDHRKHWNFKIIKEHFEKTGYWKLNQKIIYKQPSIIFKVIKIDS